MTNYRATVGGVTYHLVFLHTYEGGRHSYRLSAAGTTRSLAWVERGWQPGPGGVPDWGWRWQEQWYVTKEALVAAVLAAGQRAA